MPLTKAKTGVIADNSITSSKLANQTSIPFSDGTTQTSAARGFGFKNRFINGAMEIDQRFNGSSMTTDGKYGIDRFQAFFFGNGSLQRVAFANPSVLPPFNYYARFIRSSAGNNFSSFGQKVEGVASLSGQAMTFSFWIRGDNINSAGFTAWGAVYTDAGTFVSYSPNNGTSFSITGSWTRVTMRMDVPTITTNLGANGGYFNVFLRCSSSVEIFDISTTGWQLETGTGATDFDFRSPWFENYLCRTYYQENLGNGIEMLPVMMNYGTALTVSNYRWIAHTFAVPMRATPAITWYPDGGSGKTNPGKVRYFTGTGSGAGNVLTPYGTEANSKMVNLKSYNEYSAFTCYGFGAGYTADAEIY